MFFCCCQDLCVPPRLVMWIWGVFYFGFSALRLARAFPTPWSLFEKGWFKNTKYTNRTNNLKIGIDLKKYVAKMLYLVD